MPPLLARSAGFTFRAATRRGREGTVALLGKGVAVAQGLAELEVELVILGGRDETRGGALRCQGCNIETSSPRAIAMQLRGAIERATYFRRAIRERVEKR